MKKLTIIFAIAAFFMIAFDFSVKAQCKQQFVYTCARKGGNAIYLKDFNTKMKFEKDEKETGTKWTTVLNEGIRYRFILCTPELTDDDIVMTLYDSRNPEKQSKTDPKVGPLNSTKIAGKTSFDYICRRSGMYYISIRFTDEAKKGKTCAVGIQAFVGKNQ